MPTAQALCECVCKYVDYGGATGSQNKCSYLDKLAPHSVNWLGGVRNWLGGVRSGLCYVLTWRANRCCQHLFACQVSTTPSIEDLTHYVHTR